MEFDWAGSTAYAPGGNNPTSVSDNLVPRLRFAYGTLGGWLAGQANSNFSDADANGETLDFGGNVGEPGVVRIPQVRYTHAARLGLGRRAVVLGRNAGNRHRSPRTARSRRIAAVGSAGVATGPRCRGPRL